MILEHPEYLVIRKKTKVAILYCNNRKNILLPEKKVGLTDEFGA